MKKIILLALVTLFAGSFAMVGCGGSGDGNGGKTEKVSKKDTPTDAVVKVLDLFKEGKYYEALTLCKDADKETEEDLKQAAGLIELAYSIGGGLASYEILGETVEADGQKAVVDVNFVYGEGGSNKDDVIVEKTDKGWQVVIQ